mgnify:CR=1 FL=1
MAAAMMTQMGFTPTIQMAKAQRIGIQQLARFIFALLAKLKVGTAISATTAGRMPLNTLSTKGRRHYLVLAELVEEHGYQQDNEKRGQGSGHARHDGGWCLAQLIAYEGADIDGENARAALRDGYQVQELLFLYPFVSVYYLGLYHGYHGVATAKGDHAYLEESLEQGNV